MFLEYKSELIVGTDTDFPCQPKVKSIFIVKFIWAGKFFNLNLIPKHSNMLSSVRCVLDILSTNRNA